jgi:hypothetical protein
MKYKELNYCGSVIPAMPETYVIDELKYFYNNPKDTYHKVAYFNYSPDNLTELFPLCALETYESIYWKFQNWQPKEGRKCDIREDRDSEIFPKYSIMNCNEMPVLRGHKRVFEMFVDELYCCFKFNIFFMQLIE